MQESSQEHMPQVESGEPSTENKGKLDLMTVDVHRPKGTMPGAKHIKPAPGVLSRNMNPRVQEEEKETEKQ